MSAEAKLLADDIERHGLKGYVLNGHYLGNAQATIIAALRAYVNGDTARWQAGKRLGFPEFCPHWEGNPMGNGWYHQRTGERAFETPEAAIDAAVLECEPSAPEAPRG